MRFGHRFESRYYQKSTLSESMVVAWPLDEAGGTRQADFGGAEFDLDDINTVGTGSAPTGIGGLCASFASGSVEGLLCTPCPASLKFTSSFTISAWINPTGVQATNSIVNRNAGAGNASYWFYWLNTGRLQANVTADGSTTVTATTGVGSVPASAWVLAFAGYDGTNIYAAYNNQTPTSTPHATGIFAGTGDLALGKRPTAGTQLFDGLMAQCVAWSRWLTASERSYLYNSGNGRPLSDFI